MELPRLPVDFSSFKSYLNGFTNRTELLEAIKPFKEFESKLRQVYAQQPDHPAIKQDHLVPVFGGDQLTARARNIRSESEAERDSYILALPDSKRYENGSPATVTTIKDFKTNFNLFSEQSLSDLDWSNVVAAGSSVVTPLLPVRAPHNESKRALRSYYHEQLAPASDVDLFIYGLNEQEATEKIKQIESSIRDSVLSETTTIRTKNAITIVSEYPTRHVQIVLRLYKSITEVLTGFDVDCSCVAYDGKQVWASPRALAAFATQQNSIDLTRRSPSYENRLSKYSHRGFEIHWDEIDRKRIDPTIYERAFNRVVGLARLLVLEKLPHPSDRDTYSDKRRRERGRPELPWNARYRHALPGNVKDAQPDDVPDWLEDEDISDYHTFTIPYGPKYTAKRIEKLLFKQDLLLNAEWNRSKDRKTVLHRHPAFFGTTEDVMQDCCGFCPKPETDEDLKVYEEEHKKYISGELEFVKDDPGRQAIGSFNPLTSDDWTEMAYVGNTTRLCQAIVDRDLESVNDWFNGEDADVNRRDHTGRTPLQLACMCSSPEVVRVLIERGARLVSRIYNGLTALHIAAHRGDAEIVKLIMQKSEANEEDEDRKEEVKREARRAAAQVSTDTDMSGDDDSKQHGNDVSEDGNSDEGEDKDDDDIEMIDEEESDDDGRMTEGSFVKIKGEQDQDGDEDEPDFYDINVLAWDAPVSPLHLAIMGGHTEVITTLIDEYGADVMLPVKLKDRYSSSSAILNLVLPLQLPMSRAHDAVGVLLSHGANPAQADSSEYTNLHYIVNEAKLQVLDQVNESHNGAVKQVINHLIFSGWQSNITLDSPLHTALRSGSPELVRKVIELGAKTEIDFETFAKGFAKKFENSDKDSDALMVLHRVACEQPITLAARNQLLVDIVDMLIEAGIDVNTLPPGAHQAIEDDSGFYGKEYHSLLDIVRQRVKELDEYKQDAHDLAKKPADLPEFHDDGGDNYRSWILRTNYAQATAVHKEQSTAYEEAVKKGDDNQADGQEAKSKIVSDMLKRWRALESKLVDRGAKTFKELHPEIEVDERDPFSFHFRYGKSGQNKDRPWRNKLSYRVPDLTDRKRDLYNQLFQAVYEGNEATVKSICLDSKKPLEVAVWDYADFSPFSLAIVRGHYDLAVTILDIAAAQYQPPKDSKTYRYSLHRPEGLYEEEDDHSSADSVEFYEELVDDIYTIDDIRTLTENVQSRISPESLFLGECQLWRTRFDQDEKSAKQVFKPGPKTRYWNPVYDDEKNPWSWFNEMMDREDARNKFDLFRYAIMKKDTDLISRLLKMQRDLLYRKSDDGDGLSWNHLGEPNVDLALELGNTEMIGEIIRHTGAMLPLARLAKKSGVQLDEKPQYYQGLTVAGKKREDWAQQERGQRAPQDSDHGSPLLAAILSGNIATVEYFLSDTPLRCYEDFAETFKHDRHIQALLKADGGLARTLHSWMETRTHLALHMAIMADPSKSGNVIDYLLQKLPQYLDSRSADGTTPLQLAFQLRHYDAAKTLIRAGASQKTRNDQRENLLHTIYTNRSDLLDSQSLRQIVSLLDPDVIQPMTLQRCAGDGEAARSPLMAFLAAGSFDHSGKKDNEGIIAAMLEFSRGKDLEVMDGAGDFPVHTYSRGWADHNLLIVKYLGNRRPDLLFKENATGMTPLELADNAFLLQRMEDPPQILTGRSHEYDVTRTPSEYLLKPDWHVAKGTVYEGRKMFELVKGISEKYPRSRDLVSLLDANETARRLAEQQQRQNEEMKQREARGLKSYRERRWGYDEQQGQKKEDEVSFWMYKALAKREGNEAEVK